MKFKFAGNTKNRVQGRGTVASAVRNEQPNPPNARLRHFFHTPTHTHTHTHTHSHTRTHTHTHTHELAPMRHSKPKVTHEGRHEKENPPKEQTSSDKRMDNNNNNTRDKFRRIFGFRKGSRMRFSCFGLLIGGLTAWWRGEHMRLQDRGWGRHR